MKGRRKKGAAGGGRALIRKKISSKKSGAGRIVFRLPFPVSNVEPCGYLVVTVVLLFLSDMQPPLFTCLQSSKSCVS